LLRIEAVIPAQAGTQYAATPADLSQACVYEINPRLIGID
jgi:hypothetical protein